MIALIVFLILLRELFRCSSFKLISIYIDIKSVPFVFLTKFFLVIITLLLWRCLSHALDLTVSCLISPLLSDRLASVLVRYCECSKLRTNTYLLCWNTWVYGKYLCFPFAVFFLFYWFEVLGRNVLRRNRM